MGRGLVFATCGEGVGTMLYSPMFLLISKVQIRFAAQVRHSPTRGIAPGMIACRCLRRSGCDNIKNWFGAATLARPEHFWNCTQQESPQ